MVGGSQSLPLSHVQLHITLCQVFFLVPKKSLARFNEPGFPIGQGTSLSSNVEDTLSVVLRSMNVGKQATPRETLLLNNKQE